MTPQLEAARAYTGRGWCVVPMLMGEKRPAVRWKRYQREPPSPQTIYRWFRDTDYGVGVIFGEVSGGLASRDFDDAESYQRWTEEQPALAATLPTVATRRGFHVYCRLWPESVEEARRRLGRRVDGRGAIDLGNGELRAGTGCYSVLPPSTHPSGFLYGWSIPLIDSELPTIDACEAGFFESAAEVDHRCYTEHTEDTENTSKGKEREGESAGGRIAFAPVVELSVEEAILSSLPTGPGQRHRQVFEFARRLKAVPSLADQPGKLLRKYVEEWHRRAFSAISTKPFEETWIDFLKAWENVRCPYGDGILTTAFEKACRDGLPELTNDYDQPEVLLLAGLCRELQRGAGDRPFFLSCRDAGRLLGVTHTRANRWLFLLAQDEVIEEVEKGTNDGRLASRYRYRG
jgi:hypothetical protein